MENIEFIHWLLVGLGIVTIIPLFLTVLGVVITAFTSAMVSVPLTWVWNSMLVGSFAGIPEISFGQGWAVCFVGRLATGMFSGGGSFNNDS